MPLRRGNISGGVFNAQETHNRLLYINNHTDNSSIGTFGMQEKTDENTGTTYENEENMTFEELQELDRQTP